MGARRLREPVVQMRETLAVAKTIQCLELRVEAIRALMLARGMKPDDAAKRLARALPLAADVGSDWPFAVAWAIAWETIYWPHPTESRQFEKDCLKYARGEFALAYDGLPTRLEFLRAALEALEDARDEQAAAAKGSEAVA